MNSLENILIGLESDEETLEEFLLLHTSVRRQFLTTAPTFRLDVDGLDEWTFIKMFRFHPLDIDNLVGALGLIQPLNCGRRLIVTAREGLLILLRRLAYPNRLSDLVKIFGRSESVLSRICNAAISEILKCKGHKLSLLSHEWLNCERLQMYADAAVRRGAPLNSCWGFIDGTARPICRPGINQEEYFSGHKRYHCVKYQSVATPDGLIVSLSDAYPGRRHDAGILADSGLYEQLEEKTAPYVLYGDPAYPVRDLLLAPYPTSQLTPQRAAFNHRMSTVRQAVEWSFGRVVSLFAFVDLKKNQKLLLQEVEGMYGVAVLLANCHSCLYGNQSSKYFGLDPPSLNSYLE